jgi:hypothetical protein
MAGRGGYQAPRNPAPVSGPGALSQRTDGQPVAQLPDARYGEQAEFQGAQDGAPMAAGGPPLDLSGVVPLDAPTQMPGQPVTAGAPLGPGPGTEVLPAAQESEEEMQRAMRFLPPLMFLASQPGSSPSTRQLVRQLSAQRSYYRGG